MILQMIFTLLDIQACTAPGCGARLSQGWGSALQSVAKLACLFLLWLPPSHNVDVSGESGEGGRRTLGASAYGLRPCCSLGNCKFQDYGLFLFYVSCQQGIDTYPVRGLVPLVAIFLQGRVSGVFKIPC